jgi:hypothetical protein
MFLYIPSLVGTVIRKRKKKQKGAGEAWAASWDAIYLPAIHPGQLIFR